MSVSGEGVNFQPSEVLAYAYEFSASVMRHIHMACFPWKNKQDITSHIGYFRPKNIDKIPYVWYHKYEFFNEYCNKFVGHHCYRR